MRKVVVVLVLLPVLLLISLVSASVLNAQEVQFTRTFQVRSSFDCWRDENGEWTLELGGQGAQVLGVPGESVDYIIPYPLPEELAGSELIVVEAVWDPLEPDDPYYGESISSGDILDAFLTDDQELCVRLSTVLDAVIAPEDITQSWQDPPILGLRYIVPVEVTVQGAGPFPGPSGGIVFSPNSSLEADGAVRGWLNEPCSVQVSYQGEKPFESYQQDVREYSWNERTYSRNMLDLGYSGWTLTGMEAKTDWLMRSSKFLLSPYRILVQVLGDSRRIPDTSSVLLDEETDGSSLVASIDEYDSVFAGYLLPEADVRGTLEDLAYMVPEYGSFATANEPEAILPDMSGMSGQFRLDFTTPEMSIELPEDGWRNEGRSISLEVSDNLSGLHSGSILIEEQSWLSLPNEEIVWSGEDHPDEIALYCEGAYCICICAEDVAGNLSEEECGLYLQDFTPPEVNDCMLGGVTLEEGLNHVPYAETLQLSFTATDALSGLSKVGYCFLEEGTEPEETDWLSLSFVDHDDLMQSHELNFEVPVTGLAPSEQWIYIRLVDRAGNVCMHTYGPASLEGIGCFRILSMSDPRWEHLFLDEESLGDEVLWRGLRMEDFLGLEPKDSIDQDMLPMYRNRDSQGFHPGYALYASFQVNHPEYDRVMVRDRFYQEKEGAYETADMIIVGNQFELGTEDCGERIEMLIREDEGADRVILRYRIPPNALFCDALAGELSVQDVSDIRQVKKITELLVAMDISLLKEGQEVCSWEPAGVSQGIHTFWYGECRREEGMPDGALCWLFAERSSYGDLQKRFP